MYFRSVSGKTVLVNEEYQKLVRSENREAEKTCPSCGIKGVRVLPVTIATHVDAKFWNLIKNRVFYFSLTPDCPVMYYNNNEQIYFLRDEVKTRFGLKEKESPRPICYCLQVTEEQIADEILNKRCCDSLEDIEAYTKAGTGKWCLTTNPSGKCCREYLGEIVEKYLTMVREENVKTLLQEVKAKVIEHLRKAELEVRGMTCESCSVAVRSIIENLGGRDVSVDLKESKAEFLIPSSLNIQDLVTAINDAGYKARLRIITYYR